MISPAQIMGLSDEHIVALDKSHGLQQDTLEHFIIMQKAAADDGHDLHICSSFRSFERQLSIWNRKWTGELALNTLDGKNLNAEQLSDEQKIHAIMLWSALPGASRHHWGTDFDFYDKRKVENCDTEFQLVTQEYEADGPCADLSNWIQKHADSFGFYLPYANYVGGVAVEPWHLSFRSLAQKIESKFSPTLLYKQLEQADICGKYAVLKRLPELIERYTFNHGI
ncbi:M15 family metallopeptidase [Ningiella sp. W23]|uniref:M15 family metallopeptidase n=1 Tax=Ningiella sp. W23 TaxID=3023715 RepID=UPI003757E8A9